MDSTVYPRNNRVLVQPIAKRDQRIGSLYIPDNAHDPGEQMRVLAVGPDVMDVLPGDTVIVAQYHATTVTFLREELHFIAESDILARITDEIPEDN